MTIYMQPAIVIMIVIFGICCFLLGLVVGKADKPANESIGGERE